MKPAINETTVELEMAKRPSENGTSEAEVPDPAQHRQHPSVVPGPQPITIDEYRARQRPRASTPPVIKKKTHRSGRKLRLRQARTEAHRLYALELNPSQRKIYKDRLEALRYLTKM